MSVKTLAKSVGVGMFATGTYTGDGAVTQAIIGVGFQPRFMLIYAQMQACLKAMKNDTDGLNADMIEPVAGMPQHRYEADQIISLDADGFTVGDGTTLANTVNINLVTYTYIAFG